jgi:hypothetical protein
MGTLNSPPPPRSCRLTPQKTQQTDRQTWRVHKMFFAHARAWRSPKSCRRVCCSSEWEMLVQSTNASAHNARCGFRTFFCCAVQTESQLAGGMPNERATSVGGNWARKEFSISGYDSWIRVTLLWRGVRGVVCIIESPLQFEFCYRAVQCLTQTDSDKCISLKFLSSTGHGFTEA